MLWWGAAAGLAAEPIRGLPFTRSYPLEEIGSVARGARLGFDPSGRVAVIYSGVYSVLNDAEWLSLTQRGEIGMASVVQDRNGRLYFGGHGSWGEVEHTEKGLLQPVPQTDRNAPAWSLTTNFTDIITTTAGVYFGGWGGVVFLDPATGQCTFFAIPGVVKIFPVGDRVFVSARAQPVHHVDIDSGILRPVPSGALNGVAVETATPLDEAHTLLASENGRLLVFNGNDFDTWDAQSRYGLNGRVTSLVRLAEGGVAVAVSGEGLFLVTATGELRCSLRLPAYHRVLDLAANEAGVLWVAREDAIDKILYGSPLTTFGQRLGLIPSWPLVHNWNGNILVSSGGRLYRAQNGTEGSPTRFELLDDPFLREIWAVAAEGPHLLVGKPTGIYSIAANAEPKLVSSMKSADRLAIAGEYCFGIGASEIAVLKRSDGQWTEIAKRIPGMGLPAVVHTTRDSAWIEFGGNKVARLGIKDGRLELRRVHDMPWAENEWVSVSILGDTVMLSGPGQRRIFLDESTQQRRDRPELEKLLDRSPYWVAAVAKDEAGVLWGAHNQGVVAFKPSGDDYEIDPTSFDLVTDHYPSIQLLPESDVWIRTGRSLHHVQREQPLKSPTARRPNLISVIDRKTGKELVDKTFTASQPRLPFEQNSLSFRFFSGSYNSRRSSSYIYRLNSTAEWSALDSSSLLTLSELKEGRYHLEVQLAARGSADGDAATLDFEVLPPWHRTWPAYGAYGLSLVLLVLSVAYWSSVRARRHNHRLEGLVRERTSQLQTTMAKLTEEARNAATLAERNRLAREIHDSVQQGLTGLMLQLDSAMKLPALSSAAHAKLAVARKMVSFTRQEVQHAVWDMETPLLTGGDLGEALEKIAGFINSGPSSIAVDVSGLPHPLPPSIKHDLLRIAQEAITNAVRHASAREIAVRLSYTDDEIALDVIDDGVGFSPAQATSAGGGHFGLRGVSERAAKIGAQFDIYTSPGNGTTVQIRMPRQTFSSTEVNHHAADQRSQ